MVTIIYIPIIAVHLFLQTRLIFWTDYQKILPTPELYTSDAVKGTISLHPIKDPRLMYRVHQYMQELRSVGHLFRTPL